MPSTVNPQRLEQIGLYAVLFLSMTNTGVELCQWVEVNGYFTPDSSVLKALR